MVKSVKFRFLSVLFILLIALSACGTAEQEPVDEIDLLTITGRYGGQSALHTFEVNTDEVEGGYISLQIKNEHIREIVLNLLCGEIITVSYRTNEHGEHVVEKIE